MLVVTLVYITFLIGMGFYDMKRVGSFEEYAVAGKKQGLSRVLLSILATAIGASATIGIVDRAAAIGFPAVWWLIVGSVGLIVQGLVLSKKVRELNADTLPDVAQKTIGAVGRRIIAAIIGVSWIGVIAAQYISMATVVSAITGKNNSRLMLIIIVAVTILYSVVGGQMSVIKTDMIQAIIMASGFLLVFLYLFFIDGSSNELVFDSVELTNKSFGGMDLFNLLFVVGGTYFLGPDIMSRNLVSKDGKTAKRAAIAAGIALGIFAVIIVLIGMWVINYKGELGGMSPLIYLLNEIIPYPIAVILCLGLVSTILSSLDTCLVNVASIIEHDIIGRDKVNEVRMIVAVIGVASLGIALFKTDIIGLLTGAYSIYAPGIVFPLFIGIMCHDKKKLNLPLLYIGIIAGGGIGLLNTYMKVGGSYFPLIGMGISLVFSLLALIPVAEKK
ncbi:MAG: sodium:solute symporter family protein [Lachnospiraceae bacterium]|nr:sodium:solute symporter family protein [Lachnospiraceae bacterium]